MPVVLSSSQTTVTSDANGLATLTPSMGGLAGSLEMQGSAAAGASTLPFELQSFVVVQQGSGDVRVRRDSTRFEHRNSAE